MQCVLVESVSASKKADSSSRNEVAVRGVGSGMQFVGDVKVKTVT